MERVLITPTKGRAKARDRAAAHVWIVERANGGGVVQKHNGDVQLLGERLSPASVRALCEGREVVRL